MSEEKVKQEITEKIDAIAKAILHGKDVEIKSSGNGVKILVADKKVVR